MWCIMAAQRVLFARRYRKAGIMSQKKSELEYIRSKNDLLIFVTASIVEIIFDHSLKDPDISLLKKNDERTFMKFSRVFLRYPEAASAPAGVEIAGVREGRLRSH